jgi:hypothetical protein
MLQSRRQSIRLPQPAAQLKLPLVLLSLTLAFGAFMAWHTHAAYDQIYATTMSGISPTLQETIQAQTADFLVVASVILGGYVLVVLGVCIGYTHSLIGPLVALQRQAQQLRGGDFSARTKLRKSDSVFAKLATDLNAVAEMLEKHAGSDSSDGWRG